MEKLLAQLAETVSGAEDLEGLTRPLLELLETVTGMESTYLTRIDEPAGLQHIVFSRNTKQMQIPEGLAVPWGDTLCKRALEENRPYTDDVAGCWGDSDAARALGIQTYLSQPVRHGDGALYGTLCAASSARKPVSPEALKILGMFARILTLQVDRERRLQELKRDNAALAERALTDPLTGVANRRALVDELGRRLAGAQRDGRGIVVAFIDLDGFKAINDRHGHDTGDRFLRAMAARLAAGMRAGELLARYGGDEFVVVGEGHQAATMRNRLAGLTVGRYDLDGVAIDYPGASVGAVVAAPGETSAEALLSRADAAMYEIKTARKSARH